MGKSFDKEKSFLYRKYSKGFYVYAEPKKFKDLKSGIEYVTRYRKKHPIHSKMIPLIKQHCRKFRKQLLKYEVSISLAFNRNPYNCSKCDTKMNFVLCIN